MGEDPGRIVLFAETEADAAWARTLGYTRVVSHPVLGRCVRDYN